MRRPRTSPRRSAHAAGSGLAIDYRAGELAALGLGRFDLVTAMEVIEHVADKPRFHRRARRALAPGRADGAVDPQPHRARRACCWSRAAERLGMVPRGTHHWDDFVTPDELRELLAAAGLTMGEPRGIALSPMQGPAPVRRPVAQLHRHCAAGVDRTTFPITVILNLFQDHRAANPEGATKRNVAQRRAERAVPRFGRGEKWVLKRVQDDEQVKWE